MALVAKELDSDGPSDKATKLKGKEEMVGTPELESVFSASMLPMEYYMEMIHSLSAVGCIDASPAQGQTVFIQHLLHSFFVCRTVIVAVSVLLSVCFAPSLLTTSSAFFFCRRDAESSYGHARALPCLVWV